MKERPVILVVRGDGQFSELLREGGCEVINLALVTTETREDLGDLRSKLRSIGEYDGLFFTSPAAARIFVEEFRSASGKFSGKVHALGERARKILIEAGFAVSYLSSANTADELAASLDAAEFEGGKFLFVRGERSMRSIPERLKGLAEVDEVVVDRTIEIPPPRETVEHLRHNLESGGIDRICFFSPSGVEAFLKYFELRSVSNVPAAAIGVTTAGVGESAGLRVDFVSASATSDDLAKGLLGKLRLSHSTLF